MRASHFFLTFLTLFLTFLQFHTQAAPSGPLVKHLSTLLKWTRSSSKAPQSDGNAVQFEDGYLVETVVEGNELGVEPYSIRVSQDGELFAVDAVNSNIVRVTPPLSHYSRARLVAGSFQGHKGHVDGKPSDARFSQPKGVTMDDKGNVYVADTANLAIRKIGDAGVTTIAGGKSNVAGYRDGPSEDAKFSSDFDVVYIRPTCSLLVVDRGNAALRQISLSQEDCNYQYSSISAIDIILVVGAIVIGYAICLLQQGYGSSIRSRMQEHKEFEVQEQSAIKEKNIPLVETVIEEQEAGWPSFGQLIWDLFKLALEALGSIFVHLNPLRFRGKGSKNGLTPLRDSLIMPEDIVQPPSVQKQATPVPQSESRQANLVNAGDKYSEVKTHKIRSSSFKEATSSSKHRSSRRQEYAEYYGSGEVPQYAQARSKSQKERSKHRQRDKSGEVPAAGMESKPVDVKSFNYTETKYDPYSLRNKYGESYRYD